MCVLGLLLPHPVFFIVIYICYNSIRRVLPEFMSLQWDALLVEVNAISIFLSLWYVVCFTKIHAATTSSSGSGSGSGNGLTDKLVSLSLSMCFLSLRLLLFRLMVGSGVVKLASGDTCWQG